MKTHPIEKNFGRLYTIEKFTEHCKNTCFINYDGIGYYAFEDSETYVEVYPNDVRNGKIKKEYTHVMWYNK